MNVKIINLRNWRRGKRPLASHPSHAGTGGLLICIRCRKVQAFTSEALEVFEEQVAWRTSFALFTCRLVLYGLCQGCLDARGKKHGC